MCVYVCVFAFFVCVYMCVCMCVYDPSYTAQGGGLGVTFVPPPPPRLQQSYRRPIHLSREVGRSTVVVFILRLTSCQSPSGCLG